MLFLKAEQVILSLKLSQALLSLKASVTWLASKVNLLFLKAQHLLLAHAKAQTCASCFLRQHKQKTRPFFLFYYVSSQRKKIIYFKR